MNIAVAGLGYVGLSVAVLLSQHNRVTAYDVASGKVEMISRGESPIRDQEIEEYLLRDDLMLEATSDERRAYRNARFAVIATPTNYDPDRGSFDTSAVEEAVGSVLSYSPDATVVVKSTVPVGYTDRLCGMFPGACILFSPEFLREGHALYDNLHPSRVVVGVPSSASDPIRSRRDAGAFARLLTGGALDPGVETIVMEAREAEAVKLFANTYLATRVSFFNELDTFAEERGMDASDLIRGVCADPRVGDFYNNPSFGYGGYCLPKDTRQLLADFAGVEQRVVSATVEANAVRKRHVAEAAMAAARERAGGRGRPTVGVYRLVMKAGSDNFRAAAVIDVMAELERMGAEVAVWEPTLGPEGFGGYRVLSSLEELAACDVVLANRVTPELRPMRDRVYTRDIYGKD
ncbi:UDP-glucose 6-dehydrogenase [Collinsella sp. An271]|uniref:nucleotide sugar dehydrogenase n=1 Tax=Collinsella sp. An271 TaxID=1965616 RepID=UPI000B3AF72C|nr:nucleotide sugar dehydrogenase [Collinsella sp. An271]OUO57991.1 UDP-glucose 6-dehydrogenase [Collinsella sp. An271]